MILRVRKLEDLPIRIRPVNPSDLHFILNSWLKSYRKSNLSKEMLTRVYFSEHHKVIARLLKTCQTYIACSDKDPADIYGYIVGEKLGSLLVVHYIYVKHTFRSMGIGKLLLNQFDFDPTQASLFTHHNYTAMKLAAKFNMVYCPYIAYVKEYRDNKPENDLQPETIERDEKR